MFTNYVNFLVLALSLKDLIYCVLSGNQIAIIITIIVIVLTLVLQLFKIKYQMLHSEIIIAFIYNFVCITLFGISEIWQSYYILSLFQRKSYYFHCSFPILIYQLILEIVPYEKLVNKDFGFELISISLIITYQFYCAVKNNDISFMAQTFIINQLLENSYVKVFNEQLEDLTPNVMLKTTDTTQGQTIFTTRNKSEHLDLISGSINKELKIKSYLNSDQMEESEESVIDSPSKYQTFRNVQEFMINYLNQGKFENKSRLIIASEIDLISGKKLKYKIIIQTIKQHFIIAFIKIDSAIIKKQNNSIAKFKTRLANNFTHKLKTYLNITLGYLSNALNDRNIQKSIMTSYIQPSFLHTKLQLYQIQDLIDYLNAEQDQVGLQVTKFNLKQSLSQIYDCIQHQCKMKNIKIDIFINGQDWIEFDQQLYLYTDCQKFERVLLNLINNSYRFAPQGGELKVNLIHDNKENKLHISITDNGGGLNDDQLRLINTQAQLQNKYNITNKYINSKNKSKFGLTLQITNKLIYLLSDANCSLQLKKLTDDGGCIIEFFVVINSISKEVSLEQVKYTNYIKQSKQSSIKFQNQINKSSNNSSSRSIFSKNHQENQDECIEQVEEEPRAVKPRQSKTYQIHELKTQEKQQIKRPTLTGIRDLQLSQGFYDLVSTPKTDNKSILIVDDEPFNHSTLTLMLQKMGHKKFLYAFNGQECVDIVQNNSYNIKTIFMDLDMPVMGGFQATSILINMMAKANIDYIPIVGCTAHDDFETQIKCLKVGMIHVVTKPVFIKSLQEAYRQIREEMYQQNELKSRSQFLSASQENK